MSQFADYTYYTTVYGGSAIAADDFPALANKASAKINHLTFNRANRLQAAGKLPNAVKDATCAVAEVIQKQEQTALPTGVESETNDGYSINYSTTAAEKRRNEIEITAIDYLAPTHLMYRGVLEDDD